MVEQDFYSVPDGGTLRLLANGLEIVRRRKQHEWHPAILNLSHEKRAQRTDKVWGSKFNAEWTLPVLVAWMEKVIGEEGWTLRPGEAVQTDRLLNQPVGLAGGHSTCRIRVVCDGRYVHAYPIQE